MAWVPGTYGFRPDLSRLEARSMTTSTNHTVKSEVLSVMLAYRPVKISAERWSKLRPFVLETVTDFRPVSVVQARLFLRLVTQISDWADRVLIDLDVEKVFHPDTVERFIAEVPGSDRYRATTRARLRSIGRTVTVNAPWPSDVDRYPRARLAPPYGTRDLARLWSDAGNQPTEGRRNVFERMLGLGLGAGASAAELAHVRGTDLKQTSECLIVRLGPGRREVPVRTEYENTLRSHARSVGSEPLFPGVAHKSKMHRHISSLQLGDRTPPLRLARLRTSWAVSLLREKVPTDEVMRAMGVSTPDLFRDLFQYVDPWSEREFRLVLSGRLSPR